MQILIAGSTGLVGSATLRAFVAAGHDVTGLNRSVVDLLDSRATEKYVARMKPEVIIDAAARVGGIAANSAYPVDFLSDNLKIQENLLNAAHLASVE